MARRTFFCFHYDNDIFRVNQVRNANVVLGVEEAGFYDHSEYEEAKRTSDEAIKRVILRQLENTTVTVVLIGQRTWMRPWVRYEITESIKRKNGLLGIYIHHLRNPNTPPSISILGRMAEPPTPIPPTVPPGIEFPVHKWAGDAASVRGFARLIEEAGQRSDRMRRSEPPPFFFPGLGSIPPRKF